MHARYLLPMLLILATHTQPAVAQVDAIADASLARHGLIRPAPAVVTDTPSVRRPAILLPLYVTLSTFQTVDICLTRTALGQGSTEANPLMRPVVGHVALAMAVKAASTASTVYVSERLWKRGHRTQAIASLLVTNALMAFVATHNASVVLAQR